MTTNTPQQLSPVIDAAQRLPALQLRRYISHYAGCRIKDGTPGITRSIPSHHATLMIGLDQTYNIYGNGTPMSFVSGLNDKPFLIERRSIYHGMHIFLMPLGAYALLGSPCSEFSGRIIDLSDIMGAGYLDFHDRLREDIPWSQRFDILDEMFTGMLREREISPQLNLAWDRLLIKRGKTVITDLARETGWSRRHFSQRFVTEFGMTPKTFSRILRFQYACALLKSCRYPLVDVAVVAGFYDQPHMTRDWLEFTGRTPTEWIIEELPFIQDYEVMELDNTC